MPIMKKAKALQHKSCRIRVEIKKPMSSIMKAVMKAMKKMKAVKDTKNDPSRDEVWANALERAEEYDTAHPNSPIDSFVDFEHTMMMQSMMDIAADEA